MERLLVVVERIDDLNTALLHDPIKAHLRQGGAHVDVVGADVHDLRDDSIAGPLLRTEAEALLVVDVTTSMATSYDFIPTGTHLNYKLSLYEFTPQHDLVEVWKARATTLRRMTTDRSLDVEGAEAVAEDLWNELERSGLLWPCKVPPDSPP